MSEVSLFQTGSFKSHSGEVLPWKIACDTLSIDDWQCLALMLTEMIGPFGMVQGVPKGGTPFANALGFHCTPGAPLLLVDDVLTTGKSMEQFRRKWQCPTMGAVVFSRGMDTPGWITPIFRMYQ